MVQPKVILRARCLVVGGPTTGKTALVQTFHSDGTQFPKTYAMTLHADLCVKAVNIPETHATVELYIVDVGGNDVFREEWTGYMENANTFVFVYDVTSAESFKSAMKWIQKAHRIMKQSGHGIQGVLVANKADQTTRRVVTAKEGQEVARKAGITYFETSAATNTDVEAPFYFVAAAFYEQFMKRVDEIESTTKRSL